MNDREVRFECLKLANGAGKTESIVERAAAFSDFVLGQSNDGGKAPADNKVQDGAY